MMSALWNKRATAATSLTGETEMAPGEEDNKGPDVVELESSVCCFSSIE